MAQKGVNYYYEKWQIYLGCYFFKFRIFLFYKLEVKYKKLLSPKVYIHFHFYKN